MSRPRFIDVDSIGAFDVHVHIEHGGEASAAEQAAKKYFGDSGAQQDRGALADYYRACGGIGLQVELDGVVVLDRVASVV